VIDTWADRDRNKLAMIWVNQQGEEKKFTFWDLKVLSNKAANILLKYGINRGDRVLILLPRIPEWWIMTIALIKLGAVHSPGPTMLTGNDIKYRVNTGEFKMVVTDLENASKVEEITEECPTLSCKVLVDGQRPGWISYPHELDHPAPVSSRLVSLPGMQKTRSHDPLVIFFTSGTTGSQKWCSTTRVTRLVISLPPASGTTYGPMTCT